MNVVHRLECVKNGNTQCNHEQPHHHTEWERTIFLALFELVFSFWLTAHAELAILSESNVKIKIRTKSRWLTHSRAVRVHFATNTRPENKNVRTNETKSHWIDCIQHSYESTRLRWKSDGVNAAKIYTVYVHSCLLSKSKTFWHEFILKICYRHK